MVDCALCKSKFEGSAFDKELALNLLTAFPDGECETCSVGQNTPGPVENSEELIRVLVDPRDFDDGKIAEAPFRSAFANGLSVLRSIATDADCLDQTQEGMFRKHPEDTPRLVAMICEAAVEELRKYTVDQRRCFFVYDQTVPRDRTDGEPIAGHAGVFGRVLAKGTAGKKLFEKDLAGELKRIFISNVVVCSDFRNGLLNQLNDRSIKGEFTLGSDEPAIDANS